jgi:hypothetical protein
MAAFSREIYHLDNQIRQRIFVCAGDIRSRIKNTSLYEAEDTMGEADRTDVFAWAREQLAWERRLRELEKVAEVAEEPVTGPAAEPVRELSRRGLVGLAHPLTR